VSVIDNLSSDAHDQFYFNDKASYHHHNIIDDVMCSDVFERHRPDVVFHLAAEARIQNCIEDPSRCMETNVLGTQTILQLCKRHGVKRVVFMSTSAIYGMGESSSFGVGYASQLESDEPNCLNPYSYSKWFGEKLCQMYSNLYGLDTVCFRGFNIYGNRQPKRGSYAPVMGVFSRQKEQGVPLTIVGDGRQRRDFIHVEDVCRGLIAGAEAEEPQMGEVYNLGTGKNYSVNEIAQMFGGEKTHLPQRQGEARFTLADVSKIQSKLGWSPQHRLETAYIK
jgi:nucleoside-diphosphate-sugar epimerase